MPDLSTIGGGPSTTGSNPAASTGITITANASANTKATTWTELIASTTYGSNWLLVTLVGISSTNGSYAVDIGLGASTAEVVLIPDIYYLWAGSNRPMALVYSFPLRIPAGTRISARCQSNTGSSTIGVSIIAISAPITAPPGLDRVEACGVTTSSATNSTVLNDPGATPNTDGTWTQIIASTAFSYKWMCVEINNRTDLITAADNNDLVDIGIGDAGSEQLLISDLWTHGNTLTDAKYVTYCFPCAVASGQRLSARHRCDVGTTGDRRLDVVIHGVG